MGISFAGYILGEGNKPGDIFQDALAISAAGHLQKNIQTLDQLYK